MATLSREQILARKVGEACVELDDDGGTVRVRGLNMREVREVGSIEDPFTRDATLVAYGLVEPVMSVEDVLAWAGSDAGGVVDRVGRKIGELSRTLEGAGKSGVSSVRKRPRS